MEAKDNKLLYDVSTELDDIFGKPGSETRRKAEDVAWQEYNAQINQTKNPFHSDNY